MAFLVWATAGKSISLTGMMQATVVRAVPIALAALGDILCERVGVINIAIEGMLLAGAFAGALFGSLMGGWAGIICAMLVGGVFGLLLAVLVITYRVDQIIAGVVINLFVLGLTSYVSSQVFAEFRWLNRATPFRAFKISVLGDIPLIGPVLFNQNLFVYGALILVTLSTCYLFHTRHGLRARAVGEHPRAADTLCPCDRCRHGSRVRQRLVYPGIGRSIRREHDFRARLHRAGGDDLRALAPAWRAGCGADLRLCGFAAAEAVDPEHADPV